MKSTILLSVGLGVMAAGCSSTGRHLTMQGAPATAGTPLAGASLPADQVSAARAEPSSQRFSREAQAAEMMGQPVYKNPKIQATTLNAYKDEKGRLFGPQMMWEVVEEGGFNPTALDANPDLAYIPPQNLVVPPGMGSPVSAVARRQAVTPRNRSILENRPDQVTVTGLALRTDAAEAERMAAKSGKAAVYDSEVGWLLVPKEEIK